MFVSKNSFEYGYNSLRRPNFKRKWKRFSDTVQSRGCSQYPRGAPRKESKPSLLQFTARHPILRGERGACPQALLGYLPAGSHQQGAQTMLQRAMFQAVQTQQSAGQHISIMPPLGRQRREGHLQCEASWYTPSFRTVRARETDLSQNAK